MLDRAPLIHFEDIRPGTTAEYGRYPVTREAILAFAREYDPQPFHLDEEAGKASLLGGLAASGWHTCCALMRMNCDGFLLRAASMGAPGIAEVKWLRPVRPGDVLRARNRVIEARPSRSRPDLGIVEFEFELLNQADEIVLFQKNVVMFRRAGAPRSEPTTGPRAKGAIASLAETEGDAPSVLPFFEDVVIGTRVGLGSVTFTRDAIIHFAREYDPQPFHVDEAAAERGPFGALAASGWQTASIWMKKYLAQHARRVAFTAAQGLPVPSNGPSPGFRDLKWLRPVYVGDTITYSTEVTETRASATRSRWGLVFTKNRGVDQNGTPVFEFTGCSFLQRRI